MCKKLNLLGGYTMTKISKTGSGTAWASDSKKLVYGHDGGGGIWIADVDGKDKTQLVAEGKDPSWSPDGTRIAYISQKEDEEVWLVKADGSGKAEHLVKGMYPHWTADSKEVVYFSPETRALCSINCDNKEIRQVISVSYQYAVLSPDGKKVAYVASGGLWAADVDNPETNVKLSPMEMGLLLTWSPDGQNIAYGGFLGIDVGIWVVPTDGSQVLRRICPMATKPAWSPDGKLIAYDDGIQANSGIAVMDVEAALAQALTLQEVINQIKEALESKGAKGGDYAKLGSFLVWAEQYDNAIEAFTKGSKLEPQQQYFKQRLIECYEKVGKTEQAEQLRLQLDPGQAVVGKPAADFTLPDLNDQEVRLSDFRGKVVILDFWATWCGPCVTEIPHFIELQKEYKEQGFEMVGIAVDREGKEVVLPFVEKHGVDYAVLIGNQQVGELYGGVRSIPTTFVIDREGTISKRYVGYREKSVFESDLKELLG